MQQPSMPPAAKSQAVDSFLRTVLRSRLLDREQIEAIVRTAPSSVRKDPDLLADHFVKNGKLSRFQAHKLLRGAAFGLVLGPFQILAPLGKGGMGRVYLARDHRNQQLVALKVLPPKRARKEERLLARFQREMALSRLLDHPHLARSYDTGVEGGVYYIAMEFIPGKTLSRIVAADGPIALPRGARLFGEVALGLEHAHGRGLVHRDLKPSNIIVTPNDHAKVLDLGLAIIEGESPSDRTIVGGQGYVVGTMDYLAPEQAEDAVNVDSRADIYSLGCTMYFALTGRPPFPGGSPIEKIKRHTTEDPTPVQTLNPAIPAAFCRLLERIMAKRPEERVASAAELRTLLLPWTTQEPVLPLDAKSDDDYAAAIANVESTDTFAEMFTEEIVATSGSIKGAFVFAGSANDIGASPRIVPWWLVLIPVAVSLTALVVLIYALVR